MLINRREMNRKRGATSSLGPGRSAPGCSMSLVRKSETQCCVPVHLKWCSNVSCYCPLALEMIQRCQRALPEIFVQAPALESVEKTSIERDGRDAQFTLYWPNMIDLNVEGLHASVVCLVHSCSRQHSITTHCRIRNFPSLPSRETEEIQPSNSA